MQQHATYINKFTRQPNEVNWLYTNLSWSTGKRWYFR